MNNAAGVYEIPSVFVPVPELGGKPLKVEAVYAEDITERFPAPAVTPLIGWTPAAEGGVPGIRISKIGGLAPGRKYRIRLIASV